MAFRKVATLEQVPLDRGLCVTVDEREIGSYRVGDAIHAMENRCPHAGIPLNDGYFHGTQIICPGHGWEFDVVTGMAPGETDERPQPRYPVRLHGDEIWIDPDAPL